MRDVTKLDIDPECGVAYSLKDGMALCRLMSKLQPGAPITAPSDSSLAYKQVHNMSLVAIVGCCWIPAMAVSQRKAKSETRVLRRQVD